jgi:hypothetical protein
LPIVSRIAQHDNQLRLYAGISSEQFGFVSLQPLAGVDGKHTHVLGVYIGRGVLNPKIFIDGRYEIITPKAVFGIRIDNQDVVG